MNDARPSNANPVISFQGVTKEFPGVIALQGITFDVHEGEFFSICGENGAGKSTLMKILSGVITQYEGHFSVRGDQSRFSGTRDAERAGIAIIHQELNLVEQLSVAANLFLGREKRNRWGLIDDWAMEREARELFGQLECDVDPRVPVGRLRVGDQQLVEIAKALSLRADILIMDEPTSALTESEVARLFRVIARLRESGVTILYISHKMEEVFRLSDRIMVLRDGQMVSLLKRSETNAQQVTQLMVGREIATLDCSEPRRPGEVVLEVKNLSLPWPGHVRGWRLKDISFALRRGEIVGVAGLMGAGRTELLESLFGASSQVPEGEILIRGKRMKFTHPSQAKDAGIALVTEDRKRLGLFAQMNVRENISLCRLAKTSSGGMIQGGREGRMVAEIVDQLGIRTAGTSVPITSLSGGNQQKCIIGRWLLTEPQILLLDDPTRGIDVGAKAELYRLMDRLCRDGMAILLTSSELPELLAVSDRILVLSEGRLSGEFSRSEATEEKILTAAMQSVG